MTDENQAPGETLRQVAEDKLLKNPRNYEHKLSKSEKSKLLHELEVHQIELELQNDELGRAIHKAENLTKQYIDLYDFAPTSYVTLSSEGKIIKLNLLAAKLLGKNRRDLIDNRFQLFVSEETRQNFNEFLERAFKSYIKETCDVILALEDQKQRYIQLKGIVKKDSKECFITLIDYTKRRYDAIKLQESEARYRSLFENSPIPLWEMDFSELEIYFKKLNDKGIYDLRDYLTNNPGKLIKCSRLIKLIDVNKEAVRLCKAESKAMLMRSYRDIILKETVPVFLNGLVYFAQNKKDFQSEVVLQTLEKDKLICQLKWTGSGNQIILSTQDITMQKIANEKLQKYQDQLEERVKERTEKLEKQNAELENMMRVFSGREFRIKELRDEIKSLKSEKGKI